MLFASMLLGLVMASSFPRAFGDRGVIFACAYAALQVGRTAYSAWQLLKGHALAPNYRRMLGWLSTAAVFWITGGLAEHDLRAVFWVIAIVCEYGSPMIGFALPGMGRSRTSE